MSRSIPCNADRCIGRWTCGMACEVAWDLPVGKWPNLHMKWKPVLTETLTTGGVDDSKSAISKEMARRRPLRREGAVRADAAGAVRVVG